MVGGQGTGERRARGAGARCSFRAARVAPLVGWRVGWTVGPTLGPRGAPRVAAPAGKPVPSSQIIPAGQACQARRHLFCTSQKRSAEVRRRAAHRTRATDRGRGATSLAATPATSLAPSPAPSLARARTIFPDLRRPPRVSGRGRGSDIPHRAPREPPRQGKGRAGRGRGTGRAAEDRAARCPARATAGPRAGRADKLPGRPLRVISGGRP